MVRKLAMAVSLAVSTTLPLSVYALGLGEIRTSSALNEKFKGEIELLSVKKGQLDTLKVGLAPPEIFARAGVERPFVLTQLRFRTVRKRDGRAVVVVTSKAPIREPFLDFFVEVNWPKGKLVREYTVLLDPPVTTSRRAPRIARASSGSGVPAAGGQVSSVSPAAAPGGEYGPVRANETLWAIANRIRPRGISVHQMMVALYQANQQAFLDGNINLLKKGSILKVPQLDQLRGVGRRQAVEEFQRLSQGGAPAPSVAGSQQKQSEGGDGGEQIAAATKEKDESSGRLRITGADQSSAEKGGGVQAAQEKATGTGEQGLKQKLLLVEEQAATARQEADDLRERVNGLEKQLEEMKRLLELRNQELAQLQAQQALSQKPEERPASTEQPASAVDVEGTQESGASSAASDNGELAPATAGTVEKKETAAQSEGMEEAASQPVAPPAEGEKEPATAAEKVPSQVVPAKASESGSAASSEGQGKATSHSSTPAANPDSTAVAVPAWRQWLTDNWPFAAGGGAVALLLFGLVASRRRKEPTEPPLPPSAVLSQGESASPGPAKTASESDVSEAVAAAADSAIGDTSFLSEYSTEELRALHEDTTEVDPVSEADVYIAYGRYSQAEEILEEAMKNGDTSAAVRHKMLEVYYATQKKEEFKKLAEEMVADGQDKEDPEAWEHIQTMGRDLDRANPLFAAGAAASSALESDEGGEVEEQDSDLSLDLSSLAEEVDSQLNPDSESLSTFSNMDLELPSLQIEPEGTEGSVAEAAEAEDLSLQGSETELNTELGDLSDLGDLSLDATTLDETLADLTGDLEGVMADSKILDHPMDLEQSTLSELETESTSVMENREPPEETNAGPEKGDDSTIGDEVETKLELAKAFIEIGDAEGARGILQEVQEDGTPQQKEAAAELLAQLNG